MSLAKIMILLGSVASLIGGVSHSPDLKADASVEVSVKAKADVHYASNGAAKAKPKRTAHKSVKVGTVMTKAAKADKSKEIKTMKTINGNYKNGGKRVSSLLGVRCPSIES